MQANFSLCSASSHVYMCQCVCVRGLLIISLLQGGGRGIQVLIKLHVQLNVKLQKKKNKTRRAAKIRKQQNYAVNNTEIAMQVAKSCRCRTGRVGWRCSKQLPLRYSTHTPIHSRTHSRVSLILENVNN